MMLKFTFFPIMNQNQIWSSYFIQVLKSSSSSASSKSNASEFFWK